MKKLLKAYDLTNDEEYFQMIIDSYINGQMKQTDNQFLKLPRRNRIEFLKWCVSYYMDENFGIYYWEVYNRTVSLIYERIIK